jgi:hypothetical protein
VRLVAACDALAESRTRNVKTLSLEFNARQAMSTSPDPVHPKVGYSTAAVPFLLSRLLDLTASLCEISREFMGGRIEHDVWPLLAKVLEQHARFLTSTATISKSDNRNCVVEVSAILQFIEVTFSVEELGHRLSRLLPDIGTIVLPFLQSEAVSRDNTTIGIHAANTIRSLLRVNSECLWLELTTLCRKQPVDEADSALAKHARELLDFADSLEEQEL